MENIYKAISKMASVPQGGHNTMAQMVLLTPTALSNRIFQRKNQKVSVNLAMEIQEASETTLFAEAIAKASGGLFVPMPELEEIDDEEIINNFMAIAEKYGAMVTEWRLATADGLVDSVEKKRLAKLKDSLITHVLAVDKLTEKYYCRKSLKDSDHVLS